MIRRDKSGLAISVSDPTQKLESLALTLNGERIALSLPRGEEAGRTVTRMIQAR